MDNAALAKYALYRPAYPSPRVMSRLQRLTWLGLLLAASTPLRVEGLWPFQAKEVSTSKFEGLIDVGRLGLDSVPGTLAAFGDWNGDQS